jgi:hypothetical protein
LRETKDKTIPGVEAMKLQNWATRLDAYIAAAARMPFSYNPAAGLDCCRFTWGAINAQNGSMIGQQFAGRYATKRDALLLMKEYCGKPSLALCIHKLMSEHGFERVGPYYAQRGDALLVPNGTSGDYFGVLDLNGRDVLSVGEYSIRRVPISIKCRAWRIS